MKPEKNRNGGLEILIAEDSATQREQLRGLLEEHGYAVAAAADGKEALALARRRKPTLVISDVVMPEMDGYEFCRRLKADSGLGGIPVILVTSLSDPEEVIRALACGADNFVLKPYDEPYLLDRLRHVLLNHETYGAADTGGGAEIFFNGRKHFVSTGRPQILNLLLSTYAAAIQRNKELDHSRKELERYSAELTEQTEKLRTVLDTVLDAIISIDERGRIQSFNPAAERMFGYAAGEVIGKNVSCLMPEPHAGAHDGYLRRYLQTGQARIIGIGREVEARRKDGTLFPAELGISEARWAGRRFFTGTLHDITERKLKEQEVKALNLELRRRAVQLEAATRAKSTFLATMSHEIRTPMNGVLGMLELLSLTTLDAEQRVTLNVIRESGKSLLRIIDDILDFSRIEAGKLEVRPEVASIKEVIEGVHSLYAGSASSKGLLLTHGVDPRISPALRLDPLRLRQILNNFVSNALKFTSAGSIEIKAELIERAGGEDRVRFSVRDTGIGISAENQQQLFQPFSQAEGDTTRRFGGTGLGLSICRRLAVMMGGSIEMASEPGKGTTMILALSLPIADPKDLQKTDAAGTRDLLGAAAGTRRVAPGVAQAEAEGTLLLLADDHPINRMLLARQVNALGYAAESAENGAQALDKWKSGRFAAVLTDCHMPELDGYELARAIRRLESADGGKRTPIIACTANALRGEAEICFAAGMDDYLAKPVELKELLKKLDQWLPIPAAGAAPATSGNRPAAPAPGTDAAAAVDRSVLAEISGGDAAAERDILMDFRRVNDEDAAMLKQAVAKSDMPQVTRAAHRIKGASRMVGAVGLAGACEHIEHASRADDWATVKAGMGAFDRECMRLNAYLDSL